MSDWLEARKRGLSGTDAAVLLNMSPFKGPYTLWLEKTGRRESPDLSNLEFVKWGNRLEPVVIDAYYEDTKRNFIPTRSWPFEVNELDHHGDIHCLVEDPERPYLIGTPDGLIETYDPFPWETHADERFQGPGILEIKTTNAFLRKDWTSGPPPYYIAQAQHYMGITGMQWAGFGVLIGGNEMKCFDVPRDDGMIEDIRERAAVFWDMVMSDKPPTATGHKSDTEAIQDMALKQGGGAGEMELPTISQTIAEQMFIVERDLKPIKDQVKELEGKKDSLRNQIKVMMGDHDIARVPGTDITFSFRVGKRKGYVVEPKETRTLRRRGRL